MDSKKSKYNGWDVLLSAKLRDHDNKTDPPTCSFPSTSLSLHADLNSAFVTRASRGKRGQEVGDIIPRMPVETSTQSLLIEIMRNQADAPTKNEESVEHTHVEVVLGFLGAESSTIAQEINEADCNATVDVEDEVVLLGGRDGLDGDSVVEEFVRWEVLGDEFLDEFDTEIRVGAGFDSVANAGDCRGC